MIKILALFNNKGGVGKTTLSYHFAAALGKLGKRVLMIDLDPQCNLTFSCLNEEKILDLWQKEDELFELDIPSFKLKYGEQNYEELWKEARTIHFLLKPAEDGESEEKILPPPLEIQENLGLIPGRLTLHLYEEKISERWNGLYKGDSLALRTFVNIREKALKYIDQYKYDYVIFDTSPSLGILNKTIISTTDAFLIPCTPDIFSIYGIRNIGKALKTWNKDLSQIKLMLKEPQKQLLPENLIQFLGYTIYNAKKYGTNYNNPWNIAQAHYNHAQEIPNVILEHIPVEMRKYIKKDLLKPLGEKEIIHTHNTFPAMAQKYKVPMWEIFTLYENDKIDDEDFSTIRGSKNKYRDTLEKYCNFAREVLEIIDTINKN